MSAGESLIFMGMPTRLPTFAGGLLTFFTARTLTRGFF
jgi:hypothetical protein